MRIEYGTLALAQLAGASYIAFDTETLSLKPREGGLRLIQIASPEHDLCVVIDMLGVTDQQKDDIKLFFSQPRVWTAHNAVFDVGWLQQYGWHLKGEIRCTMLAAKLITNGKTPDKRYVDGKYEALGIGLKDVLWKYLKVDVDKTQQSSDWSGQLTKDQLDYAAKDACLLPELDSKLSAELDRLSLQDAYDLECRAIPALAQMQRVGIPWDRNALNEQSDCYSYDIEKSADDFYLQLDEALPEGEKLPRLEDGSFNLNKKQSGSRTMPERWGKFVPAGFNIGSPKQLRDKLTVVLGEVPKSPATGKPSADKKTLKQYEADHPFIATYLEWRRLEKRRSMVQSMIESMDQDGFVKSSYMQLGAITGRMTSSKPNMQQQPRDREFRSCAVAPEGWVFVDADYQAAELRIAAAVSGDEKLKQHFVDGVDVHQVTADTMNCERQVAKSANFSLLYGGGAEALKQYASGMGVEMTVRMAERIRNKWLSTFPTIAKWQRRNREACDLVEENSIAFVRIPTSNMVVYLPGEENKVTNRCNYPCQGVGAAMLKVALGNLWEDLLEYGDDKVTIAAVVHDEILLMAREEYAEEVAEKLTAHMEHAESLFLGDVPSEAEAKIGKTWADCH